METAKKPTMMIGQAFGIGDVLFIQKIIHHYADMGFHVVAPILNNISWIRYYIKPHPNVEYPVLLSRRGHFTGSFKFADIYTQLYEGMLRDVKNPLYKTAIIYNEADIDNGFIFLPLSSSYAALNDKLMPSKYNFVGLDFADWVDHVHLKRRTDVERELYYDVLGLKDDSRYTLVNEESSRNALPLAVPGNIVKLGRIDGFTLFDWSLVIERAAQIVTIDTSLVLLAEILRQKKPLYMISRYNPPSFEEVKDILSLDWNLIPTPQDLNIPAAA